MKELQSFHQNSYFKDRYINPNNIFNQIETDLRLIQQKCDEYILKINSQHEQEMFVEVLDHLNEMIKNNSEKQIIFKQNHSLIINDKQQQLPNINLESQIKYEVTLIFQNETIDQEFKKQLSFRQFYHFLLEKYTQQLKSIFVILDQNSKIINIDDWDQLFIYGNNAHFIFIIQSLQNYLNQQQSQIIKQEVEAINSLQQSLQKDQRFTICKSFNASLKEYRKPSLIKTFHSSIQKFGGSLLNNILYRCQQCHQDFDNQLIMLKCLHNFHEDCLTSMLKIQIETGQTTLSCVCKRKIKINELNLLTRDLKENVFKNQINEIYQRQQGQFMKCNNCQFYYMKSQNKSQIKQKCLMCED